MDKNLNVLHAQKLYKLRRDSNLKQEIVANALGKSQQSYSKLEKGDIDFSDEIVDAICSYFKISLEEFTDTNSKTNCINSPNSVQSFYNSSNNNANNINNELLHSLLEELKSMREERKFFLQAIEKITNSIEKLK